MKTLTQKSKKGNKVNAKAILTNLAKVVKSKKESFENSAGKNKQKAREIMVKYITLVGNTLTLPFKHATIEKMLLSLVSKKFKFVGYERETEVFWELCKTIGKERLPISPILGSISEAIMNAKPNQYANLILDYCGVLDTFAKEITFAIKNDIMQKNGIMAVTLSKIGVNNESGIIGEIFRRTPIEMFNSNIGQTELGVKLFFNNIMTDKYKMETVFNYSDTKADGSKGMAMILVIIKRIA